MLERASWEVVVGASQLRPRTSDAACWAATTVRAMAAVGFVAVVGGDGCCCCCCCDEDASEETTETAVVTTTVAVVARVTTAGRGRSSRRRSLYRPHLFCSMPKKST